MLPVTYLAVFLSLFPFITGDIMFERVQKAGIELERHSVITDDGYILGLYHLVRPLNTNDPTPPKPILFWHGLLSSSQDFVIYPNSSAGYYFYNNGFDVWMGNARGNTFSRNHTTLDPDGYEFWQFEWHDIGVYDLPAMIDFILAKTKQSQLNCVGHSQGGTVLAVLLSERPEYSKKISIAHLLAPAIILKHYNPVFQPALDNLYQIKAHVERSKKFEMFSHKESLQRGKIMGEICSIPSLIEICKFFYELLLGPFAPHSFYDGFFKDLTSAQPNGSGYLQLLHFAQIMISGRFHKLDHGPSKNMKLYGSRMPPEYNLTNIQTKVHVMYGTNDFLVSAENFPMTINKLGRSVAFVSRLHELNHIDFVYGRQVHIISPIILRVIKKLA